jgi:hypothetical protein
MRGGVPIRLLPPDRIFWRQKGYAGEITFQGSDFSF